MGHEADRALVDRVLSGDPEAFAALEARTRAVIGACLSRALASRRGPRADADDLRQAFYLRLVEDDYHLLRTYRAQAALTTWIHTLAARYFHRELGRVARRREVSPSRGGLDERPDEADDPERAGLRAEQVSAVRAALAELGPEEQVLLKLLVEQEAPARVVAATVGITPDGVRMRKMRILKKLVERLKEVWP